jgi:Uma2 family endonuclease
MNPFNHPSGATMEAYQALPEGTLAELIQGVIYQTPSPQRKHQRIIGKLFSEMFDYVEAKQAGEVYVAPFDVYLDESENAVQPDILFVAKENLSIIKEHIHGSPDLVIEVLSGDRNYDLKIKKALYEKFGVKEYWVIDPDTREAIGFVLTNAVYQELPVAIGKVSSSLLRATFNF